MHGCLPEPEDRHQVALVTGAARRLGRAISLALARAGIGVVVHYHTSGDEADALVTEIRALGVPAWPLGGDLREEGFEVKLMGTATDLAGPVSYLVNNAAVYPRDTLAETTAGRIEECVRVNATAPLLLSRAFAAQGRPGAIVNLLDARMGDRDPAHVAYHLSKRMLAGVTRACALEFAPVVRVNGVAPGLVLAPAGADPGYLARLAGSDPLGRAGTPEEVAGAVLFLLRNEFVTGQVVYVDGGRHLRGADSA